MIYYPIKVDRSTNKIKKPNELSGDVLVLAFPNVNPARKRQTMESTKSDIETNSNALIIMIFFS